MASDNIMYFLIVYLLLGGFFFGLMPDSFFSGTVAEFDDPNNPTTGVYESYSFISKVATFLFIGITINGLPTVLAGILNIFNIMSIIMATVWGINKFRGVS